MSKSFGGRKDEPGVATSARLPRRLLLLAHSGQAICIAEWLWEKSGRTPRSELNRAESLRAEHLVARGEDGSAAACGSHDAWLEDIEYWKEFGSESARPEIALAPAAARKKSGVTRAGLTELAEVSPAGTGFDCLIRRR